ncbi:voltage-gated potassium channel protein [Enterovibrio nigricans]|uniref:Voltage-gated potassium channel n=1 Tax=Enterovibrio nigricans DSM 22720 TaxID=1121868 RepID=A0A1T4UGB8_9GAMM|nr:voltage-gated potassium channel protein [Enterovibrio nigricans]SKA51578.1 voltage-gated potassium channel [Enterovibrio nigricans DSM 22720]
MKWHKAKWDKFLSLLLYLRHILIAGLVFLNGVVIFRAVWGQKLDLIALFNIKNFANIDWAHAANGPWLLLGAFLMLNALGLLFRARVAWAVSLILLIIAFTFNWHFFPHFGKHLYLSAGTAVLLFSLGKDFHRSSATAGGIAAFISFAVLLFYSTYGALYFGGGFKPQIHDLMTAFYFSMVTMTTVGYGDIIPQTEAARLFTVSVIIAGITVFATSLTTVFGPIIRGGLNKLVKGVQKPMNRKNHFLVCGTSVLATSTVWQLSKREMPVTLLTIEDEDKFLSIEQRIGRKIDILSGDSTDSEFLKEAGAEQCKAVLALTEDDATNAFIVLSVKSISPDIKVVAAVNDAKNLNKVKQVNADVVISPQLFGSKILASVLAGESIDNDQLLEMLLGSGKGLMKGD